MADRIYTIPLRKSFLKEPRTDRAKRSIQTIKIYMRRHAKAEDVMISKGLSELIYARNVYKPPSKVSVQVVQKGARLLVKLPGEAEITVKKKETRLDAKKGIAGLKDRFAKAQQEKDSGKKDKKEDEIKEEKKEEIREISREEALKPEEEKSG